MDILKFDQCVMISQNQEVDLSNCDMIDIPAPED